MVLLDFSGAVVLAIAMVAGIVALIASRTGQTDGSSTHELEAATWVALHRTVGEHTHVVVLRQQGGTVVEQQVLDEIAVRAADYETRLHEAMSDARMRAAALNSERDG